jgi:hypothetical protein
VIDVGIVMHALHQAAVTNASAAPGASARITNGQHTQTIQLEWVILSGVMATLGGIAHIVYRTGKAMQMIVGLTERVTRLEVWRDGR